MEIIPIIEPKKIRECLKGIADEIRAQHGEQKILLVPVLNAAYIMGADISRLLSDLNPTICFVLAKSYVADRRAAMGVVVRPLDSTVYNDVQAAIILDVVIDTGRTLAAVGLRLHDFAPRAEISAYTLVAKPDKLRYKCTFPVYSRIMLPGDPWLVGFGLDSNGKYRSLQYIGETKYGEGAVLPG